MKHFLLVIFLLFINLSVFAKTYDFNNNYNKELVATNGNIYLSLKLNSDISSLKNSISDNITAQLLNDCYYTGKMVAPEGSLVSGKITKLNNAGYGTKHAKIEIQFEKIVRPDGSTIFITSMPLYLTSSHSGVKTAIKQSGIEVGKNTISAVNYSSLNNSNYIYNSSVTVVNNMLDCMFQKGDEITIPFNTTFTIMIKDSFLFEPYNF